MPQEFKDLGKYFANSPIGTEMTSWKQEGRELCMIFLPIEPHNNPQSCIQKFHNEVTRLDFILSEVDDKLYFYDIISKRGWQFDVSDLHLSKFYMVGESAKGTFVRETLATLKSQL